MSSTSELFLEWQDIPNSSAVVILNIHFVAGSLLNQHSQYLTFPPTVAPLPPLVVQHQQADSLLQPRHQLHLEKGEEERQGGRKEGREEERGERRSGRRMEERGGKGGEKGGGS